MFLENKISIKTFQLFHIKVFFFRLILTSSENASNTGIRLLGKKDPNAPRSTKGAIAISETR